MKNILFFSNHLRGPHGSAGARSWHQVKHLSDMFKIRVILPAIDPVTARSVTPDDYAGLPDTVEVSLVNVRRNDRSSKWRRAVYYMSAVPKQIWHGLRGSRPDIVLAMSLPITTLGVAWLTSALRRSAFAVDVRDMPYDMAEEIGYLKNRMLLRVLRGLEAFFLRRADIVLTNSPRYAGFLSARGVNPAKITVAMIGYDDFEDPSAEEIDNWRLRLEARLAPQTRMIGVYSGTLGYAMPVEEVLNGAGALAEDKRFGFVFLGDGQRIAEFREYSEKHGLNAFFAGRVNKEDVMAVCRAGDYCIYPAAKGVYSGAMLGNKVFDYLGAGRPVLYVGDDSAVWDLLNELGAGICVNLGDADGLARVAKRFLTEPNLVKQLENGANKLIERGYTAEASAKLLTSRLKELAGEYN